MYLVTGASGFLGRKVVDLLTKRGEAVRGVDLLPSCQGAPGYEHIEKDLENIDSGDLCSVSHVIHLAGETGTGESWGTLFSEYCRKNVVVTAQLLEVVRQAPAVTSFVYSGSSSVYGNSSAKVVTESTEVHPYSPYAITKLAGENLVAAYRENYGVSTRILRLFYGIGEGCRPNVVVSRLINSALTGEPMKLFGDPYLVGRDFVDVVDLARAIIAAADDENGFEGPLNIASERFTTLHELRGLIEAEVGRPAHIQERSDRAGYVMGARGDSNRALARLGWEAVVPVEQSVRNQVDWQRRAILADRW